MVFNSTLLAAVWKNHYSTELNSGHAINKSYKTTITTQYQQTIKQFRVTKARTIVSTGCQPQRTLTMVVEQEISQ